MMWSGVRIVYDMEWRGKGVLPERGAESQREHLG